MERMADRLAARRMSQFVGRADELALVESLLRADDDGAVVFVHGPGGVGKTTFLRRVAALAVELGRHVVLVDGRDVPPIPAAFVSAVAAAAGRRRAPREEPAQPDPAAARAGVDELAVLARLVLLVDTAERLGALDRWLREEFLPALPADAVVVVAGREGPGLEWRTDPGWRCLVHSVRLENLTAAESRELLEQRGVSGAAQERALQFTRGHPLALALVADVADNGGADVSADANPAVVSALLGSLVDSVPGARHRAALEVCAQVLTTTEPLLATLLGHEDAHEVFEWLRGLSIIETGPRGLFPHDLARDALGSELRWRHPEQHADIHRRAGGYYRQLFHAVEPSRQQQVLVEYVFLHRENPVLGPLVTAGAGSGVDLRSLVAVPVSAEDEPMCAAARAMVVGHEGEEAGDLVDHWLRRQPGSVQLVVGPDGDRLGLVATVALAGVSEDDRARDPAVNAVAAHLDQLAPLRPDEVAVFFRCWLTADGYQDLGPVQLFITLHFVRTYLATPGLVQSYVYYADPELWAPICAYSDMQRIAGADFTVGGRRYGVFGHDWRATPPLVWLELLGEREISRSPLGGAGTSPAPVPMPSPETERLSDGQFAAAVKDALRGLGRADGLRESPLLGTRLVARRTTEQGTRARTHALREAIREAAARLEASPRDRRGFRALHHTYLQPAPTQAAAADLLDLPMTTYRRHLAEGIERLTEILLAEDRDA